MRRDRRPGWMLRKHARISMRRKAMYGEPPPDAATWWQQVVAAAADLQLEPGQPADWEPQPLPTDDDL